MSRIYHDGPVIVRGDLRVKLNLGMILLHATILASLQEWLYASINVDEWKQREP